MRLKPLTYDAFRTMLADLLDVDTALLTPEAYFVPDLGVDSIRFLEAMLKLEKAGLEVSLDSIWRIETVGDAYEYYQEQASAKGGRVGA